MRLTDEVVVDAGPDAVFDALTDPVAAAPCLPGAWVRDHDGRAHPAGLTVRVGPVTPAYRGTLRVVTVDRAARRLVLAAHGRDERDDPEVGPAGARLEVAVDPAPDGGGAVLRLDADLVVRGRVARCGRGVLGEVCRELAAQFARGLGELAATRPVPAPWSSAPPSRPPAEAPDEPPPGDAAAPARRPRSRVAEGAVAAAVVVVGAAAGAAAVIGVAALASRAGQGRARAGRSR